MMGAGRLDGRGTRSLELRAEGRQAWVQACGRSWDRETLGPRGLGGGAEEGGRGNWLGLLGPSSLGLS